MTRKELPELLLPAGNLEKLKTAILYGADAVYVGGERFGLRARADNFSLEELKKGADFCHLRGRKFYVVLNAFLHDKDMLDLPDFVKYLSEIAVDAVIVADIGVLKLVKRESDLKIHLSTQSCCLNSYAASFWKECGVERIVLGREVSIEEAQRIKKSAEVEVEMFVHGSMCISYSGQCVISNYTAARDSNRGGCAHSCRFEYSFGKKKSFFMSSKDLMGIKLLPLFCKCGIDSLKIEGRMKSQLYVATVAKAYRQLLDCYDLLLSDANLWAKQLNEMEEELRRIPYRDYVDGNLLSKAQHDSVYYQEGESGEKDRYMLVGHIVSVLQNEMVLIEVKNAFTVGEWLEILPFKGRYIKLQVENICSLKNIKLQKCKPNTLVKIKYLDGMEKGNIIRKKK
ncbi:MAG: U32 family peptidase [Oligoflexia bacterium]|nr:U32 family peptidase [Oligoflexia bacterium]